MPGDEILFEIEPLCEAFEAAWMRGEPPEIADFLEARDEETTRVLFEELLALDLEYRARRGLPRAAAEYVARYPRFRALVAARVRREPAASQGRLADYLVREEIGRGGMGVVYRADQISLDRTVALKLLPRHAVSSPAAVERFQRESQAAARLHHGNIVPIFESGETDGTFFFAMQLIEGESLDKVRRRLADGSGAAPPAAPRSGSGTGSNLRWAVHPRFEDDAERRPDRFVRSVARIGLQVSEALAHAHARGIVHRDVKPANLILDRDGVVWVTDFGLARLETSELTTSGEFVGTLRYMSPERLRGHGDERGDIYGLGATLYEIVTRRALFDGGDHVQLIDHIELVDPKPPRAIDPRLPRDFETILLKALAKDIGARYESAGALANDLRRFLEGRPILARRASPLESLVRLARRHRALTTALGAVLHLLVVVAVGAAVAASRFAGMAETERGLREVADQRMRTATETLYVAQMNLAGQAATTSGGFEAVRRLVDPWRSPTGDLDPRGWEWRLLDTLVRERGRVLPVGGVALSVDWHPTLPRLAVGGVGCAVHDARTFERTRELLPPTTLVRGVRFSPDGERVAATSPAGVHVWSLDGAEESRYPVRGDQGGSLAWSPDGRRIAAQLSSSREIVLLDAGDGTVLASTRDRLVDDAAMLSFDRAGRRLAAGMEGGRLGIFDAETLETIRVLEGHEWTLYATAFSPDGRLASGGFDGVVRIWDPVRGTLLSELRGHEQRVMSVSWRPDGLLASTSWDYSVRIWDPTSGVELVRLRGPGHWVTDASWSPDGRQLTASSEDGTVTTWPVRTNAIQTIRDMETVTPVRDSSMQWIDGDVLLLGNDGDHALEVPARSASLPRRLARVDVIGGLVTASPDGRWLASVTGTDVEVRARETLERVRRVPLVHRLSADELRWHPRDPVVAWTEGERWVAASVDPSEPLVVLARTDRSITGFDWSPSGARIAMVEANEVRFLGWPRVRDGGPVARHPSSVTDNDGSPDGSRVVAANRGGATLLDARTATASIELEGHTNHVIAVAWHPSGSRIATAARDRTVRLFDPATGASLLTLATGASFHRLEFSPDGRALAGLTEHAVLHLWDSGAADDADD
ncbi:MAG: protein kinase [Planctomycetota bacterium JB042]